MTTENKKLLMAARRLLPADGYISSEMPDDEAINLVTTVGAVRELMAAIGASENA